MKKILITAAAAFGIICTNAFAAEYTLQNNLLCGVPSENVVVSRGTITTDGDKSITTSVLYDGLYDTVSGNSGTRWAVEDVPLGAELTIDLDKIANIGKIILVSGYTSEQAVSPETWESFKIEYWDGTEYVLASEISGNKERFLEIEPDSFSARKLKFTSTTSKNFRVRELILLEPGTDINDTPKVSVNTSSNIKVLYNSEPATFYKDSPVINDADGKVLVPVRMAEEDLGAQVRWDDNGRSAVVIKDAKSMTFCVDKSVAVTNDGKEIDLGTPTVMEESRVYVPVRALAENLGYSVSWYSDTSTVNITDYVYDHMINAGNREYTPYTIYADGQKQDIFTTINCDFVQITADEPVYIEAYAGEKLKKADIRPLNLKIESTVCGESGKVSFYAEPGQFLSVEFNENLERPLFVFINKPIPEPDLSDPNVIYFEGGKRHNIGKMFLSDNAIVYLGKDAVIDGGFSASNKKNIKIIGNGIINGTASKKNCTYFYDCEDITVEGAVCVGSNTWLNPFVLVNGAKITDYKVLGSIVYSDGIDLLGCKNIEIDHIFVRNEDDCVAIKTVKNGMGGGEESENISVINSTFWNGESGNSMEIGYELDGSYVRHIRYKNNDTIHRGTKSSKFNRAAISIHHAGNSVVSDVVYEDIRVESTDEGLVHFAFFNMENWGSGNGTIKDITIRNLTLNGGPDAPSYLKKNIDGKTNVMENIKFVNLTYKGIKVTSKEVAKQCGFIIEEGVDVDFIWEE